MFVFLVTMSAINIDCRKLFVVIDQIYHIISDNWYYQKSIHEIRSDNLMTYNLSEWMMKCSLSIIDIDLFLIELFQYWLQSECGIYIWRTALKYCRGRRMTESSLRYFHKFIITLKFITTIVAMIPTFD